jgi:uncharacterized membrane protein HdeD (DUF308 family)
MASAQARMTPAPAAGPRPQPSRALEYWYLFGIAGLVSVAVGVLVLAYPEPSLKLLGIFLGIDLLVAGTLVLARGAAADRTAAPIILGTLALIAGLVVIRNPGKSIALLTLAFGIYLVVAGALAVAQGLVNRARRGVALARGAVLLILGTIIVSWPDISLKTLALLAGISLILHGVAEIAEAFLLRAASRAAADR